MTSPIQGVSSEVLSDGLDFVHVQYGEHVRIDLGSRGVEIRREELAGVVAGSRHGECICDLDVLCDASRRREVVEALAALPAGVVVDHLKRGGMRVGSTHLTRGFEAVVAGLQRRAGELAMASAVCVPHGIVEWWDVEELRLSESSSSVSRRCAQRGVWRFDGRAAGANAGFRGQSEEFSVLDLLARLEHGLGEAFGQLPVAMRSVPLDAGSYNLVFSQGASEVVVHELMGHLLESDMTGLISEDLRQYGDGWLGVDVVDNGRALDSWVASELDDQARPTVVADLVRDGCLVGRIGESSGQMRRQSIVFGSRPRMRAIELKCQDYLRGVDAPLFVDSIVSGLVSPGTRSCVLRLGSSRCGDVRFWGGSVVAPVEELMRCFGGAVAFGVDDSGRDRRVMPGDLVCTKGGQRVPVVARSPQLLFREVRVRK